MTVPYAVLTPLHNEAENLPRLVDAMDAQTQRPDAWLLLENGSTDETPELARSLAAERPYVRVVTVDAPPSGGRGAPIVHALHTGLQALRPFPPAVAQVDADVSFANDYFARLLARLEADRGLGIVSGTCFERLDGGWQQRFATVPYVWGAARLYRRECLEQVLPFEPRTGWDAVDVAKANALDWQTAVETSASFYHHRPESSREQSAFSGWTAQGRVSYFLGYRFSYLLLRAGYRARRDPAAVGLLVGYLSDVARGRARCADPMVRTWVRRQQRLRDVHRRAAEARGPLDSDRAI